MPSIADPWFAKIAGRYGEEYARLAGYFDEDRPFTGAYADVFDLPSHASIIQFSGAFHPFHEGHLKIAFKPKGNAALALEDLRLSDGFGRDA